jgi:uncharacterized cupin superfamily protein
MKPILNLDDVAFDDVEENGIYTSCRGQISDHIGAKKLGYNLTVLPPGKVQCPFHCHHGEEEMFLILEGEVEACEYPDSQKVLVVAGPRGDRGLRKMVRAEVTVDYYDREKKEL